MNEVKADPVFADIAKARAHLHELVQASAQVSQSVKALVELLDDEVESPVTSWVTEWLSGSSPPISSFWATNSQNTGSAYQLAKLEAGKRILPTIEVKQPQQNQQTSQPLDAADSALVAYAKSNQLPLVIKSRQPEDRMMNDNRYRSLPFGPSPNPHYDLGGGVIDTSQQVAAFGATAPMSNGKHTWRDCGNYWVQSNQIDLGTSPSVWFQSLFDAYPNPPLVWWLSNNEANLQSWTEVSNENYFLAIYPTIAASGNKQQIEDKLNEGFLPRYQELFAGIKERMPAAWQSVLKFIAFAGLTRMNTGWGPEQQYGWADRVWDGDSPAVYYGGGTDRDAQFLDHPTVKWAHVLRVQQYTKPLHKPNFVTEYSFWTGTGNQMRNMFVSTGLNIGYLTTARYKGMVRWIAMLTDARVLRDFHGSTVTLSEFAIDDSNWAIMTADNGGTPPGVRYTNEDYVNAQLEVSEEFWDDAAKKNFVVNGAIVRTGISWPSEMWALDVASPAAITYDPVLLACSANPPHTIPPLSNSANNRKGVFNWTVYACARKIGNNYLVYAFAPRVGPITTDITVDGNVISGVSVPVEGIFLERTF